MQSEGSVCKNSADLRGKCFASVRYPFVIHAAGFRAIKQLQAQYSVLGGAGPVEQVWLSNPYADLRSVGTGCKGISGPMAALQHGAKHLEHQFPVPRDFTSNDAEELQPCFADPVKGSVMSLADCQAKYPHMQLVSQRCCQPGA